MLKKSRRVSRVQFSGLARPYKSITGSFFVMRLFQLPASSPAKFAVSISKKQEKRATGRNRIRRLAYGAIQTNLNEVSPGVLVHFILQKSPKDPKSDVTNDIIRLLSSL